MAQLELQLDQALVEELEKLAISRGVSLETLIIETIRENMLSAAVSRAIAQPSTNDTSRGCMPSKY